MRLIDSLKMALITLKCHRLRTGLTILGLVIGNAAVITLVGVGEGSKIYAQKQLASFGNNLLTIFTRDNDLEGNSTPISNLVLADAEAIKNQLSIVSKVAPLISSPQLAINGDKQIPTFVKGTNTDFFFVRNYSIERGRIFSHTELEQQARVVIIGKAVDLALFPHQNSLGREIKINNLPLIVIGITKRKGVVFGEDRDNLVIVPITTTNSQIVGSKSPYGIPLDYIQFSVDREQNIRTAAFQIVNLLARRHGKLDIQIQSQKAFLELTNNISQTLTLALIAIAGISLLVGGIGVMNIMLVSVSERTQEIGLRKAIGAKDREILIQFLIESIVLCIIGGIIGISFGLGSIYLIAIFTSIPATVSSTAIILSVVISGFIGIFFGVIPAHQAAKLEPIVALTR